MTDLSPTWGSISEADLQASIIETMEWMGWLCYHTHDSRRSNPGYPDLTAVKGSRLMFVEFKSEKGKVKPDQIEWLDALVETHGEVYLVRPSNQDEFLKIVKVVGASTVPHWRNMRG